MFSPEEQYWLDTIEQDMEREDPTPAQQQLDARPTAPPRHPWLPTALMAISAVGFLVGALTSDLAVFVVAGAIPFCVGLRLRLQQVRRGQHHVRGADLRSNRADLRSNR